MTIGATEPGVLLSSALLLLSELDRCRPLPRFITLCSRAQAGREVGEGVRQPLASLKKLISSNLGSSSSSVGPSSGSGCSQEQHFRQTCQVGQISMPALCA